MDCENCDDWRNEYIKMENKYTKMQKNFIISLIIIGGLLAITIGVLM